MKGLLIFLGESFRTGGQCSRIRGEETSVLGQKMACESHSRFIKHISEKYSVNIDVHISTYNTPYNELLLSFYENPTFTFYDNLIGLNTLFHNSIKSDYDFIFYLRIDIFLKQKLFDIFNPNATMILFPSVCFIPYERINGHPRISDTMLFIPKKYFEYIKNVVVGHSTWHILIQDTDLTYRDMDTLLNTYHDSDSEKDFNPIYYIVNRNENNRFHTKNILFDKNIFNPKFMPLNIALFGFIRNCSGSYNFDITSNTHKKYIYTPSIVNEDTEEPSEPKLAKFGNSTIELYHYDKQKHIEKAKKVTDRKFLNYYQQPYRIFSFFYNIRGVLNMIEGDPEEIILLARIDIGMQINKEDIYHLMNHYDVLLGFPHGFDGTDGKFFIFKLKHKDIFTKLYDDYEKYIVDYLENKVDSRPQAIFKYHFDNYNLSYKFTDDKLVKYDFHHVCSRFCGHNGDNTDS